MNKKNLFLQNGYWIKKNKIIIEIKLNKKKVKKIKIS